MNMWWRPRLKYGQLMGMPHPSRSPIVAFALAAAALLLMPQGHRVLRAQSPAATARPLTLSFDGQDYVHRWSKNGQHEFTPPADTDLSKWTAMLTINVHKSAKTGEQLADVANRVLGNYQKAGKIVRTDSKPRTKDAEAEHLAVAVLGDPKFLEAAFARFLLHDGRGMVVVYSKRVYGAKAGDEMSAWLQQHGPDTEKLLMAWSGIPSLAVLKALPESRQ